MRAERDWREKAFDAVLKIVITCVWVIMAAAFVALIIIPGALQELG